MKADALIADLEPPENASGFPHASGHDPLV